MNILKSIIQLLQQIFAAFNRSPRSGNTLPDRPAAAIKPAAPPSSPTPPPPAPLPKPEPKHRVPPIPLDEAIRSQTLDLGAYDGDVERATVEQILASNHAHMGQDNPVTNRMRHGDLLDWSPIRQVEGQPVRALQTFLINAGLLPTYAEVDGIFGYRTLAGVRLFQEYERIYGSHADWIPDGIVGPSTWKAMLEWQQQERKADRWTRGQANEEYRKWMKILKKAQAHYQAEENWILDIISKKVKDYNAGKSPDKQVDTLALEDWHFAEDEVHLVGIRRREDEEGTKRKNDDLFLLLINGMVFKFWGSTDPKAGSRADEAFMVEGQHKFRFGWHKKSDSNKTYQGLNPYGVGVLVFRDRVNDNQLNADDLSDGITSAPNTTIHIHWTGEGLGPSGTWSAGCQVIAGHSYIDNAGEVRKSEGYAAVNYAALKANKSRSIKKTMGAYDVFCDLILAFAPKPVDYIYYTLGRDDVLNEASLLDLGGEQIVSDTLSSLNIRGGFDTGVEE